MLSSASQPIWLFDLDNTLHDASHAVFGRLNGSMTDYIVQHLGLPRPEADALRVHYWRRYGATLLGLERHHGVRAASRGRRAPSDVRTLTRASDEPVTPRHRALNAPR